MLRKEEFVVKDDKTIYPGLFDICIDNNNSPISSEIIHSYNANDNIINIWFWNDKLKSNKLSLKEKPHKLVNFVTELENLSEQEITEYFVGKSDIHIDLKQLNRAGEVIKRYVYTQMIYMGVSKIDSYDVEMLSINNVREGRKLMGITFFALDSLTKEKTNKLLML